MELENNWRANTNMIKNVCQSLFEAPPHQIVSHSPLSWKLTSESGFDQVLAYNVETYTKTIFKFPATMILRQHKSNIKCGVPPVKHGLPVVLGYIRSLLRPAPRTPHASLASCGMPKALWNCYHFLRTLRLKWLLTPQLRKCDVEQGDEETTLT